MKNNKILKIEEKYKYFQNNAYLKNLIRKKLTSEYM